MTEQKEEGRTHPLVQPCHLGCKRTKRVITKVLRNEPERALFLVSRLKFLALHFPLDTHEKIEVHAFGFEPAFEGLAGIGAKLDEHFPFEHVDEDALGASRAASLHSLGESFSALTGKARQRVLGEVAWHRSS